MIILADVGTLSPEIRERLAAWIEQGGVLVRFAGPRLAQADDDLVPVKLRRGGRSLGGSLTWEKPQHLTAFTADGPFAGLSVPKDVTINRQVLAEPDAVLATKSWASLEDGTPLVTGEHRGKGVVALFHVSADMRWSDLPMSGTSSRCCGGSSICPAIPPIRAPASPPKRVRKRWRRCISSTVSAPSGPPPSTAKPLPADYRDRATGRTSARLLRPGRRPARGQHAGSRRPHRAARHLVLERTPRQLHQCRTARPARHPAVDSAGPVPDRRRHRRAARCRDRRPAAAARGARRMGVRGHRRGHARRVIDRARASARRFQRRFRHQGHLADPARLCRHRQCRRRFHRQGGHGRADAVPRAANRAGSRRPRRHRSRA